MTSFITIDCCNCGIEFGILESFNRRRQQDGRTFYCPSGHPQSYKDNEQDRIRRERDQLKQQMARKDEQIKSAHDHANEWRITAEKAEHRRRAAAGQVTKLKKRAANGVCPCCNRTFGDLGRHMASQHPAFMAEIVEGEQTP